MSKPVKIFITYAHKDADAKEDLITSLAVMKRNGLISHWHDNEIIPGDKWRDAIFSNLAESDILLYLTSAASLASENCNKELAAALDAKIKLIPIILEPCDWLHAQYLSDFQALPDKGKPIIKWDDEREAWQNVVDGIRRAVSQMQSPAPEQGQNVRLAERIFELGNFLAMLRQFNMAIEAYSDVIDLNPLSAAYSNRGGVHREKGAFDDAIADFTKAIELDPNCAETYSNRGGAYLDKGEVDTAIADFTKAIELDPNFAIAYYGRGSAYDDKYNIEKAIADYNKAIELTPDYAEAYSDLGVAYAKKGEVDDAIANYTKAIERNPNYAAAYNNRGIAYVAKDDLDTAIADFTTAIERNPNYAAAYNGRGVVYMLKGEIDTAINDFYQAIALNPNYVLASNNRDLALRELQERAQQR